MNAQPNSLVSSAITVGMSTGRSQPVAAQHRMWRYAVMTAAVGLWMGVGVVLNLSAVPYLLAGVPRPSRSSCAHRPAAGALPLPEQ